MFKNKMENLPNLFLLVIWTPMLQCLNYHLVKDMRPGADGLEILKIHAISRIFFNNFIDNLQVSWLKKKPEI